MDIFKSKKNPVYEIYNQLVALSSTKGAKSSKDQCFWIESSLDNKKAYVKVISKQEKIKKLLDFQMKLEDLLIEYANQKNDVNIKNLYYIDESLKIIDELLSQLLKEQNQ